MSVLRRVAALLRRLDRADLRLLRLVPSGLKRRLVRTGLRSLLPLLPRTLPVDGFRLAAPRELYLRFLLWERDPALIALLHRWLAPGMVAVDIGANVGYLTLHMSRAVGPEGRVLALEPAPENVSYLLDNVRRNHASNVEVLALAASARREIRRLHIVPAKLMHSFYSEVPEETAVGIPTVAVDDLLEGPVHLVKVDAEGADLEVLEGMEKVIEANPDLVVLVEWYPDGLRRADREPEELPAFLRERGFTVHLLSERAGGPVPLDEAPSVERPDAPCGPSHANLVARRVP